MKKELSQKKLVRKEKRKEKLVELIGPAANGIIAAGASTIDIFTTGYPVFSGMGGAYTFYKTIEAIPTAKMFDWNVKETVKEGIKINIGYFTGMAIPFAIKYHNEIYSAFQNTLEFMKW
jgi:hypothetical protein